MSVFTPFTPETATGRPQELLRALADRDGNVGPMVGTMAHSPAVLQGYVELSKAMKRAKLAPRISERIALAVQQRQGCEVCLAFHTDAARALGIVESEIQGARLGTSEDPTAAAAIRFALQVHAAPWSITDADRQVLLDLELSEQEIADIVGLVALQVLTGAFNLATGVSRSA